MTPYDAARKTAEELRLEKRLKESEEQLRHIQKVHALGRLAGGIAHDLNNILSVIIGSAEFLLKTTPPGDPGRADLEEILKAGGSAAELTRQLMTFSRKQAVRPKPLELDSVIPGVLGMARRIIPKTIAFKTALKSAPARVLADRGQVEQVLINLLVNARDAMPDGGTIQVETSRTGSGAGRRVLLAVSDTGHGMNRRIMGRLFEPFFTTKDPGEGSGLGLSTIHGIVRQSGGDIHVDSEPGIGSTFRIRFPETADGDGTAVRE
ncbi:MAG: hypothetical protein A3J79_14560 [Elusimicrobia bacterium RIFOXYB2_FULL_62_6]|nr:MAG: hypothetical protein A3J79_14560 [Elusimicrobia bacterium RIFOXYB2_FULL_62_6]